MQGKTSDTSPKGQSPAQTLVGGEGVSIPISEAFTLQKVSSLPSHPLDEIVSFLWSSVKRLEDFSKSVAAKDREKDIRIQELSSKWEEERHNHQDLAHKYNDVVVKLNTQLG